MRIRLTSYRRRVFRSLALLGPLALAAGFAATAEVAAQDARVGHRVRVGTERPSGSVTVTPHSGAAGTVIAVRGEQLPPGLPVQIMIGAIRSGFEVVGAAVSDEAGQLAGSSISEPGTFPVTIPEWVERDRSYLLILTDRNYNPLAVADVFYPTDAQGMVLRKGRFQQEESACQTLVNDQEEVYFLLGNLGRLKDGDEVTVEGRMITSEACGPGPTIEVARVEPASR